MDQVLDVVLILILALNFYALGVSRIRGIVNAVALQGVLLGIVPLLAHGSHGLRGVLLLIVTVGLKGVAIPRLILYAMREAKIQHEVKPIISPMNSLFLAGVGTGLALALSSTLPLADQHAGLLIVPASLSTVWNGFLLMTARRKAITQVLGYLVLENGIFLFGVLLLEAMPLLVELGVLLDVFTGVFVMGIIVHQINREFATISTEHLAELKE